MLLSLRRCNEWHIKLPMNASAAALAKLNAPFPASAPAILPMKSTLTAASNAATAQMSAP